MVRIPGHSFVTSLLQGANQPNSVYVIEIPSKNTRFTFSSAFGLFFKLLSWEVRLDYSNTNEPVLSSQQYKNTPVIACQWNQLPTLPTRDSPNTAVCADSPIPTMLTPTPGSHVFYPAVKANSFPLNRADPRMNQYVNFQTLDKKEILKRLKADLPAEIEVCNNSSSDSGVDSVPEDAEKKPAVPYDHAAFLRDNQQNIIDLQQPQQPVQQSSQQPTQQPVHQPIHQHVQQPIQQPVHQHVQQPIQQPVHQHIHQPIQQPMQQPIQRPMQPPICPPMQAPAYPQMQQMYHPHQHLPFPPPQQYMYNGHYPNNQPHLLAPVHQHQLFDPLYNNAKAPSPPSHKPSPPPAEAPDHQVIVLRSMKSQPSSSSHSPLPSPSSASREEALLSEIAGQKPYSIKNRQIVQDMANRHGKKVFAQNMFRLLGQQKFALVNSGLSWIPTKEVGRGASGPVYAVRPANARAKACSSSADQYIIKTEILCPLDKNDGIKRFSDEYLRREIALLNMDHPNMMKVIKVYADFKEDLVQMLMPRMQCSLEDFRNTRINCQLPEDMANFIGFEVSKGLTFMHKTAGFYHGDIKPANVLMSSSGEIKLSDFGLSGKVGHPRNEFRGTFMYAAPEMADPNATSCEPSDMWSFGIMMIEFLDGRIPALAKELPDYEASTSKIMELHAKRSPPTVQTRGISIDLLTLLSIVLKKDPRQRPTAFDFEHALRSLINNQRIKYMNREQFVVNLALEQV